MGKEAGKSMGTVDERVKKLSVSSSESKRMRSRPKPASWKISAPTRSIRLSW